jgi:phosphoenolpyruvate phosphomutase
MGSAGARLKEILQSDSLEFLMEAHNGLSARIVEETGFRGIWASGLCISATLGLRDNNEASWTQIVQIAEFMADAVHIPILLDGDTGHGNFNTVRRLVRKVEQRGIAGLCIEDNVYPKTNSYLTKTGSALADTDEFSGRIRAAKDTQRDPGFCILARTEALIAGRGLNEALTRATAYSQAGADAIIVHSKSSTAEEILGFMELWDGRCPVVIIPTTYPTTPTTVFSRAGISLVIWANHILRSSISAMRESARQICQEQSVANVSEKIASIQDIFDLQDMEEYALAEARYLPETRRPLLRCADKARTY